MACRDEGAHRVDVDSGLVHSVVSTAANIQDLTPVACRLHGPEMHVHADAGDTGRSIRTHCRAEVAEHVAMRPGQRRQLNRTPRWTGSSMLQTHQGAHAGPGRTSLLGDQAAVRLPAGPLARLTKNTAQIITLFVLSNLWIMRRTLTAAAGELRL